MTFTELVVCAYRGFKSECRTRWHGDPQLPPVLLIGGALQRKDGWGRLEAALAARTTVITVDLPGWGSADVLPADYGMSFLADSLAELLSAAGHGPVHVFGGSYGSAIGYRFGQLHPDRVLRMALFGAMSQIPETARPGLARSVELLRAGRMEEFAADVLRVMLCQDPTVTIARRRAVHRILFEIFRSIRADDIAKYEQNTLRLLQRDVFEPAPVLRAPMLFGAGEHDTFTTPLLCRQLAETCPDAWFAVLRDADHPVHLERPDELADLLLRFYDDRPLSALDYCKSVERLGTPRQDALLAEDPVPVEEEVRHGAGQARDGLGDQGRHPDVAEAQHDRERDRVVDGDQQAVFHHLLADMPAAVEGEVPVQPVVRAEPDDEAAGGGQRQRNPLPVQGPQRPGVDDVAQHPDDREAVELFALEDPAQ
jgi:pimeloyl-ACP methyl ester carboxylesterase